MLRAASLLVSFARKREDGMDGTSVCRGEMGIGTRRARLVREGF